MKRQFLFPLCAAIFISVASSSFALEEADKKAVEQLVRDYTTWRLARKPADFVDKLDFDSFDKTRPLLIALAEAKWQDWRHHWTKLGVKDIATLKALSPEKFWNLYYTPDDDPARKVTGFDSSKIAIEIHAVTEAKGVVYVIFTFLNDGNDAVLEGFQVERAKKANGRWVILASPVEVNALKRMLEQSERDKEALKGLEKLGPPPK